MSTIYLWQGPPALFLKDRVLYESYLTWSPDGRWLASNDAQGLALLERGTNERRELASSREEILGFTSDSRRLVTRPAAGGRRVINVRALPEGRLEHTLELGDRVRPLLLSDRLLTLTFDAPEPVRERSIPARILSLDGTIRQELGFWKPHGPVAFDIDPTGTWIVWIQGGRVLQQRFDALSAPPRVLGTHKGDSEVFVQPWRERARVWVFVCGRVVKLCEGANPTSEARYLQFIENKGFLGRRAARG